MMKFIHFDGLGPVAHNELAHTYMITANTPAIKHALYQMGYYDNESTMARERRKRQWGTVGYTREVLNEMQMSVLAEMLRR